MKTFMSINTVLLKSIWSNIYVVYDQLLCLLAIYKFTIRLMITCHEQKLETPMPFRSIIP